MEQFTNNRITQVSYDTSTAGALSEMSKRLILVASTACYINFNQDSVSATTGFYLPADVPITVDLSKVVKIAVIKSASAGKLTILELF